MALKGSTSNRTPALLSPRFQLGWPSVGLSSVGALLIVFTFPIMASLDRIWQTHWYSHGYLVAALAVVLLVVELRRAPLPESNPSWAGFAFLCSLVVVSLASSWASFYFKREADKYYNQYQRASDSRDMISLYSKTERYDRMSEIAIAVSAVTLGTYLYILLFN